MDETSISLLARIRSRDDIDSWRRFTDLYTPLLQSWIGKFQVQDADADDLIQEILSVVASEIPSFDRNANLGSFRSWLKRIMLFRLQNYWRSRNYRPAAAGTSSLLERLGELEDESSDLSQIWNMEHDLEILAKLLDAVRPRFIDRTWEAFRLQVFEGQRPDRVAATLGISLSSVYVARNRVLTALRREAEGMIDSL